MREHEGLPEEIKNPTYQDAVELSRALERQARRGEPLPAKFKPLERPKPQRRKP